MTAVKAGYTDSTDLSDSTAPVVAGTIDATGSVTISGTSKVGETLTGNATVETTPAAFQNGQWLRDGVAIDGADEATYDLANADAGATITFQITASLDGYDDATYTSDGVGPVDGGDITLPDPAVTGTPVVDGTLTASLSDATLDPADADVSYEWTRGSTVVGSGSTYAPTDDDAGEKLTSPPPEPRRTSTTQRRAPRRQRLRRRHSQPDRRPRSPAPSRSVKPSPQLLEPLLRHRTASTTSGTPTTPSSGAPTRRRSR